MCACLLLALCVALNSAVLRGMQLILIPTALAIGRVRPSVRFHSGFEPTDLYVS